MDKKSNSQNRPAIRHIMQDALECGVSRQHLYYVIHGERKGSGRLLAVYRRIQERRAAQAKAAEDKSRV
jgi:hypothetical protein